MTSLRTFWDRFGTHRSDIRGWLAHSFALIRTFILVRSTRAIDQFIGNSEPELPKGASARQLLDTVVMNLDKDDLQRAVVQSFELKPTSTTLHQNSTLQDADMGLLFDKFLSQTPEDIPLVTQ